MVTRDHVAGGPHLDVAGGIAYGQLVSSPFHPGERAVQERAGVRAGADKIGASIDDAVPPAAAHFLAQRYTLYVGSVDAAGRPWASQLVGPPGFVSVPSPHSVRIDAAPGADDPLAANLRADPRVGLLALDPLTRRRYRVNGSATVRTDGTIEVAVAQAYGNCPKYIQRREPIGVVPPDRDRPVARGTALTGAQRARLERADTFFLATVDDGGADVSHRGGAPGFLRVLDDRTLAWPDYQGNMMFMSLGNVAVRPVAGLLIVDFDDGDVLQLTGDARIDWDPARAAGFAGAQRVVELRIHEIVDAAGASPVRWRLVEPSPFNP